MSKKGWVELKRDIPNHMVKQYASDKKVYRMRNINQDVDWRLCLHLAKKTTVRTMPHVNPHTRMKKLLTKRDTRDCYVSKTFKDHKKD